MRNWRLFPFIGGCGALLLCAILVVSGAESAARIMGLLASIGLALGLGAFSSLRGYQYTAWIIVAVVAGMLFPQRILYVGGFDMRHPWLILAVVQLVMFGMGTQMSPRDLKGVAKRPRGVMVGLLCQFSIMPLMGFLLSRMFAFPPEIAAGIVLIGTCSSGLASNVMAYLARANLALSVTVTTVATLCAPLATPLLMRLLAGTLVEVHFVGMMLTIIKIVVVPIGAAMLSDILANASPRGRRLIYGFGGASLLWLLFLGLGGWQVLASRVPLPLLQSLGISAFMAGAVLAGIGYCHLRRHWPQVDRFMPYLSMFGIIYFTTVTTAAGQEDLMRIGLLLFLAAVIHNGAGYLFGYWISRLLGLDINSARAMALEVGLQNGGMASGIAGSLGKLGTLGLASAVFSPWMNITGSILANYWAKRPVEEPDSPEMKDRHPPSSARGTNSQDPSGPAA